MLSRRAYAAMRMTASPLVVSISHTQSAPTVLSTSLSSWPLTVRNTTFTGTAGFSVSVSATPPLTVSTSSSVGKTSSVKATVPLTVSASSYAMRALPLTAPLVVDREISPALAALTLTFPLTLDTSSS